MEVASSSGRYRPPCYFSRKFSQTHRNYSTIVVDALSDIYECHHLHDDECYILFYLSVSCFPRLLDEMIGYRTFWLMGCSDISLSFVCSSPSCCSRGFEVHCISFSVIGSFTVKINLGALNFQSGVVSSCLLTCKKLRKNQTHSCVVNDLGTVKPSHHLSGCSFMSFNHKVYF